ncbi:MAG TPA: hypothetical protein PKE55_11650 [Kiritimatiellia bacterium]|nr:hypothetical protein [Kiritimatiellia bacterium]
MEAPYRQSSNHRHRVSILALSMSLFVAAGQHTLAGGGHVLLHQGDVPYTITTAGAYTLVENMIRTNGAAIVVEASDVVIDLNGFRIAGGGTSGAIVQQSGQHRLTVRNGQVGGDISAWYGILSAGMGNRLEDLNLQSCSVSAIFSGPGAMVRRCVFRGNAPFDPEFAVLNLGPGSIAEDVRFDGSGSTAGASLVRTGPGVIVRKMTASSTIAGANPTRLVLAGGGSVMSELRTGGQSSTNTLITASGPVVLADANLNDRVFLPTGGVIVDSVLSGFNHFGPGTMIDASFLSGSATNTGPMLVHDTRWPASVQFGDRSLVRRSMIRFPLVAGSGSYYLDNTGQGLSFTGAAHRIEHNDVGTFRASNSGAEPNYLFIRNRLNRDDIFIQILDNTNGHWGAWAPDQTLLSTDRTWSNVKK